jgi:hypothetical protein
MQIYINIYSYIYICSYRTHYLTNSMKVLRSESMEQSGVLVKKCQTHSKVNFKRQTSLLMTK